MIAPASEDPLGPAVNYGFAPDAARASRLDQAVRAGLVDSLKTIFESLDPSMADGDRRVTALLNFIEAAPAPPALFGVYVDLVLALFADRDPQALLDELLGSWPPAPRRLRIVTLDDHDIGEGQSARYRRLLRGDIACEIEPVLPDTCDRATAQIKGALGLIKAGAPDLFAEFRALVREVVLVRPGEGPEGVVFGGASTFSLWGALVLNADRFGDRLDLAVSLAHEAAHSLLFGLAVGGQLTENDAAERYSSPLRRDPRPMEGVAHATYVTARMAYALEAMIGAGVLDQDEMARAGDQLAHDKAVCIQGLATVMADAGLTPAGEAAFAGLRQYVRHWD